MPVPLVRHFVAKGLVLQIVIDFHATWCGPCKVIAPKLEELSRKHSNVLFLKVDVDQLEVFPLFCAIISSKQSNEWMHSMM